MHSLRSLVKRNCLVFLRDRAAVFFSLMAMFIVLLLMVVFLGDMNVKNVTSIINEVEGNARAAVNQSDASNLVQMWTIAGIIIVNAVTVTLSVVGVMVNDREQHRLESFFTTPVSKTKIALGYIISSILIGTLLCLLTFGVSIIYVVSNGGTMLTTGEIIQVILNTLLNVCVFSFIMYFISLVVKSEKAWSSVASIVGTLVGFAGAIYIPMGGLPKSVANVLKCTPVLHGTALMRDILCESSLQKVFEGHSAESVKVFREIMGIDIIVDGKVLSAAVQYSFIAVFGVISLAIIFTILRRQKLNDR